MKFQILLSLVLVILSISAAIARSPQKSERKAFCNQVENFLNPDSDSDLVLDLAHCKKSAKISVVVGDGFLHFFGDVKLIHGGSSKISSRCQLSMIATDHGLRLEGPVDCN